MMVHGSKRETLEDKVNQIIQIKDSGYTGQPSQTNKQRSSL